MKSRRINMTLSRTLNDGNYGSYKATLGIETDIDDTTNLEEAYEKLYDEIFPQLELALGRLADDI